MIQSLRGVGRSLFRRRLRPGAFVAVVAGLAAVPGPVLAQADPLPPGFVESQVVYLPATGGMDWAPDGSVWLTQYTGVQLSRVWLWENETLTKMAELATEDGNGERGIHGIAVDPDYLTTGHVWIYYTPLLSPARNRLSRFTRNGSALENEEIVFEGPDLESVFHNGGCLAFAADKTLFLGIGDDAQFATTAQDPFDVRGSILHLKRDGTPAVDNPYLDGLEGDPRVWAIGMRNPFRCNIEPASGNLYIGDVGGSLWEEINIGAAGGNFGWPWAEGNEVLGPPPGPLMFPLYAYPHDGMQAAVIGGDHAPVGQFAPQYEGDYFFGDYARTEMFRMALDENQNLEFVEPFWNTGGFRISDMQFGPDGALYYTVIQALAPYTFGEMGLRKIEFVGGDNSQPIARATATPDSGPAPLMVTLDGSASEDPDEDPLTYDWDLGDGNPASGVVAQHTYPAGVYEARLTVDDGELSAVTPPLRIVSGNQRPVASIDTPSDGANYNANQLISFSGSGNDAEESDLPCDRLSWRVIFHHAQHTHPFLGPVQGVCAGSFTTANRGETSADTWYEIELTVSDTGVPLGEAGVLTGTRSVEIFPNTSTVTLDTDPPGLPLITLDTVGVTPPHTFVGVVDFLRDIEALDQTYDGHAYQWVSWSDGGARMHTIATPASDTTFTANFVCDVIEEVEELRLAKTDQPDEVLLSWLPVTDACLNPAAPRYEIWATTTARPASEPGSFPLDPAFTMVGSTFEESFSHTGAGPLYYLVLAVGSDLQPGPAGHYPTP